MQGTIVERPLTRFVGVRVTGTFESLADLVPEARRTLLARQYGIETILDPDEQLGVTRPDEQESSTENVTTYIGFAVGEYRSVPTDLAAFDLPAGSYVRFDWQGSFLSQEFERFYPEIFSWFKGQGLLPSERIPWIEVYGSDHNWENKDDSRNRLTVFMPLGGHAA